MFDNDVDINFSARFLMQLGALRALHKGENKAEVDTFIKRLGSLLETEVTGDYLLLIDLFENTFKYSPIKSQVIKKLFGEYLPLNMIIEDINEAKSKNPEFQTWGKTLAKVIKDDAKPVQWQPLQWMRAIDEVLRKYTPNFSPTPASQTDGQ
jgi:hypothetical protein